MTEVDHFLGVAEDALSLENRARVRQRRRVLLALAELDRAREAQRGLNAELAGDLRKLHGYDSGEVMTGVRMDGEQRAKFAAHCEAQTKMANDAVFRAARTLRKAEGRLRKKQGGMRQRSVVELAAVSVVKAKEAREKLHDRLARDLREGYRGQKGALSPKKLQTKDREAFEALCRAKRMRAAAAVEKAERSLAKKQLRFRNYSEKVAEEREQSEGPADTFYAKAAARFFPAKRKDLLTLDEKAIFDAEEAEIARLRSPFARWLFRTFVSPLRKAARAPAKTWPAWLNGPIYALATAVVLFCAVYVFFFSARRPSVATGLRDDVASMPTGVATGLRERRRQHANWRCYGPSRRRRQHANAAVPPRPLAASPRSS